MLASEKDVFTPMEKWNQYRNEWSDWEHMKR